MTAETKKADPIKLTQIARGRFEVRIIGDSSLIVHNWSKKAKMMMLDKQMKKSKKEKEIREPEEEFKSSLYYCEDGQFGFPATAFKLAAARGAKITDTGKMVDIKCMFHVQGPSDKDHAYIEGVPTMREDMVRIGMGTSDLRYRAEFKEWGAIFNVEFNTRLNTTEQLLNMFDLGGFHCGVGEWRPETGGDHGRFHVAREGEWEELLGKIKYQKKVS